MIMTLVFLTFYPFNGFFSFQSLIVAYRCKLELWDDDKVKNIVNPFLFKINVGRDDDKVEKSVMIPNTQTRE